jgi:hypothetical protein
MERAVATYFLQSFQVAILSSDAQQHFILYAAQYTAGLDLLNNVPTLFYPSLQGFQIMLYAVKPHTNWRLYAGCSLFT